MQVQRYKHYPFFSIYVKMSYMQQQAFEHTERKQNKKRFTEIFLKREKMITTESTHFQGQKVLNRVKNFSQVCCCLNLFSVRTQMDSILMFFPSYTHVFAASCSHRDSTAKIQEARVTALVERESAKLATIGKTKCS